MDLQTVKAYVKAWEKAFKTEHGRIPTKDDIKNDQSGIADQYALYRKLSKLSTSTSSSSSTQRFAASSSSSQPSLTRPDRTPRHIPSSDYPTTPTPPPRRSNSNIVYPSKTGESSQTLKRTASIAALNNPPSSPPRTTSTRPSFITPVKPRAYSGPIVDPNPLNPFSTTPTRSSASKATDIVESPFIHASSPRKLKEVLAANSLRKVRDRLGGDELGFGMGNGSGLGSGSGLGNGSGLSNGLGLGKEITPRTRARKRLKGEEVEDTPMKDKIPRRSRGSGLSNGETIGRVAEGNGKGKAKVMMMEEDHLHEDENEFEEDEFGPSPMKPVMGARRSFTQLINEAGTEEGGKDVQSRVKKKEGRQRDIMTMFGKMNAKPPQDKGKGKAKDNSDPVSSIAAVDSLPHTIAPITTTSTAPEEPISDPLIIPTITMTPARTPSPTNHDRLSTPPPDPEIDRLASQSTPDRPNPTEKVLTLSDDDEADEWDPEGGAVKKQLYITGTRRAVRLRRNSSDDELQDIGEEGGEDDDDDDDDDEVEEVTPTLGEGTSATSPTDMESPRSNLAPPLLSLLSLRSPVAKRSSKLDDLRVRAIFNPTDAARLRAIKRGQDVPDEQDEEDDLIPDSVVEDNGGEGDDDWEEECNGWKRTGLGMDDDEEDW